MMSWFFHVGTSMTRGGRGVPPFIIYATLCKLVIFVAIEKFSINDILKLLLNIIVHIKCLSNLKHFRVFL